MSFYLDRICAQANRILQRLYLISSLQSLVQQESTSPSLCSVHIRLLISPSSPAVPNSHKVLKFAQKYTSNIPKSAEVWLARLDAEKRFSSREAVEQAWTEARKSVEGTADDLGPVWVWGLELYELDSTDERRQIHKVSQSRSTPHCCTDDHDG
jgi:U3 small nucleolar RNA-associated protein 6